VEWVHQARCKDEDPELFFPVGTAGPALAQIDAAKAVCSRCEVRSECLEWAMTTGQDAGVWGGLSEEERRSLRRARRREQLTARMAAAH
jgi:WhiB family redox-sensing transcriptional regulator